MSIFEATAISYRYDLTDDQMLILMREDGLDFMRQHPAHISLLNKLENIGLCNIDWSGHFGAAVFFTLDLTDEDTPNTEEFHLVIKHTIDDHIAAMPELREED